MDTFYYLSLVVNFVMPGIPFFIGLYRWRRLDERYLPIVAIMGTAFVNELFRCLQLLNYGLKLGWPLDLSLIGYNLYVLIISLLFLILFKNLGVFGTKKGLFRLIFGLFVVVWFLDHFILKGHSIHGITKFFRIFYSFVLSLIAIQKINNLVVTEKNTLFKNPAFLICICMLSFFMPYIITECIMLFIKSTSPVFQRSVYNYRKISNIVIYLIYLLAIIWIPPKRQFIQLS
ncbi:MAG: hypothetical protein MUE99_00685 [Chitinophagaceae bacterium]|jgi:hypothetical protein|nr:hypothetical protein [Chitinophagaceae bacterium]